MVTGGSKRSSNFSIFLHPLAGLQPFLNIAQNSPHVFVFRRDDAVMRSDSFASGFHDVGRRVLVENARRGRGATLSLKKVSVDKVAFYSPS